MFIKDIKLYNFRNIQQTEPISFSPGVNFFVGQNGQGKTNLIEAIHFLGSGRSFRTAKAKELTSWEQSACSVFGNVSTGVQDSELGLSIQDGKRAAYLNGNKVSSFSDYLGKLLTVSFSPTDLELVRGGPAERRRFMDKHLSELSKSYFKLLVSYQKALKNKNALLRTRNVDPAQVLTWNSLLAGPASKIVEERQKFLTRVVEQAGPVHRVLSLPDGELEIDYKPSLLACSEDEMRERLDAVLQRDIALRKSSLGPHRDEFTLGLFGKQARSFASQGQARSLVLTLKMAALRVIEEETGESPVVLLDDVESELDFERRRHLFEYLRGSARQVFITGTHLPQFGLDSFSGCKILELKLGALAEKEQ